MDERIARTIHGIGTFKDLAQFEANARKQTALTPEIEAAIRTRSKELGRTLVAERTGLDLSRLTEAEEKIVEAVSEYAGIMKRQGKDAGRTLMQLKSQGLIGAAEISVSKAQPTQGYQELVDADLTHLSYEQIILDHPDDFSTRAIWYAKRTLGIPNDSDKPPARKISLTQSRTETLLRWLAERRNPETGRLSPFSNADGAAALGIGDLSRYGRPYGNIQSRIDFACYQMGLPPLGLAAEKPFDEAWSQEGRTWAFPISAMQAAAQSRSWRQRDFDAILKETESLPGHQIGKPSPLGSSASSASALIGARQRSAMAVIPWSPASMPCVKSIARFFHRPGQATTFGRQVRRAPPGGRPSGYAT